MADKNPAEKFAYLDQLSTEELEEIVRAHMDSPENQNEEAIFHILGVLNKRAEETSSGPRFEKEQVWHDIQTIYNIPEGAGHSLYPTDDDESDQPSAERSKAPSKAPVRKRLLRRRLPLIAAAAILLFSCLMVGAQAVGIDVFGFLARWTADTFHFAPSTSEFYSVVQDTFDQNHFPKEQAPQWYPKGFVMDEPEVTNKKLFTTIVLPFSNDSEGRFFFIQAWRYSSPEELAACNYQWEPGSQEEYTSGNKTFVIVENEGHITATWSDQERYVLSIAGDLSLPDIEKIIDSIDSIGG